MPSETLQIVSDPAIIGGKPILAGTRISVELILELLARGQTRDEIVAMYPNVDVAGIRAAIEFAAESIRHDGGTILMDRP